MYAVKNNDNKRYASRPGSERSYTTDPAQAALYRTIAEAKKNCCGNEYVVELSFYEKRVT